LQSATQNKTAKNVAIKNKKFAANGSKKKGAKKTKLWQRHTNKNKKKKGAKNCVPVAHNT